VLDSKAATFLINQKDSIKGIFSEKAIHIEILGIFEMYSGQT